MNKKIIIGLFSCLVLIQIVTPLSMIGKREAVLKNGKQFKFKTAPVDPFDAFRGRYVALRIESDSVPNPGNTKFDHGQKVYAHITKDRQGFATFSTVTTKRPYVADYLITTVRYAYSKDKVFLDMPFDRYYMEEEAAPAAERAYRQHSRRKPKDAYITVRIKSGFAVLEELYVGGKPILEFIQQNQ